MPRYEYRKLEQLPDATKAFDAWLEHLDREFANKDVTHRSEIVRDTLHELYLGRPYAPPKANAPLAEQALVHTLDPRNATLEPDLNDGMIITNRKSEIGPRARITYHATVMSGVNVGEHGMVGSMGVATKDVPPYHIVAGIPAKPIKVKTIAPESVKAAAEKK